MRPIGTRTRPFAMLLLGLAAGGAMIAGCSEDANPDLSLGTNPTVNPPPISGGTLLVTKDGRAAVAADPDRDRVWIVDLEKRALAHEVTLRDGDEPGRVVEDGSGRVHVALRSGGALVSIDLASGELLSRRAVCPAPRGVAHDASTDLLHVACAGGELVTLPAAGGKATRRLQLERDLRDVLVDGDRLLVSRLKTAEVLVVDAAGTIAERALPPSVSVFSFDKQEHLFEPTVAWRMVAGPEGSVIVVHQRATTSSIELERPTAYGPGGGNPCDGDGDISAPISHSALTTLTRSADGSLATSTSFSRSLPAASLPVDVAISPSGAAFASVAAGSFTVTHASRAADGIDVPKPCNPGENKPTPGQPTAVAFVDEARVVVQLREPAALYFPADGSKIVLPGESRFDTGHDVFHRAQGGSSLACASCHPEGHEDGRVWNFNPIGARRTQDIAGGILATAPLHWDGDMTDMSAIMSEVLGRRMGGTPPGPLPMQRVEAWIDALPALPRSAPADMEAVARGEALFNDEAVGCASCHGGPMFTNNKSVDVGTGKAFQVPSLVGIASRAPFMHDGCAPTLQARFGGYCGGGDAHGKTSQLSQAEVADLVAYLETL